MGQTNPRYDVIWLALLSCEDCAPHTGGLKWRKQAGDIISVSRYVSGGGMGKKTPGLVLSVLLEGGEENFMSRLNIPLGDDLSDADLHTAIYDKRRYCIPFERLAQVVPGFNVVRARDCVDNYQPFRLIDQNDRRFCGADARPLSIYGLVFDKVFGRYL